jgi:hypothetical protein
MQGNGSLFIRAAGPVTVTSTELQPQAGTRGSFLCSEQDLDAARPSFFVHVSSRVSNRPERLP